MPIPQFCKNQQTGDVEEYDVASYYMLIDVLGMLTNLYNKVAATQMTQAASILSSEFFNRQDLDGDGKICGIDFYISTNKPALLAGVPNGGIPMTWDEYKISHPQLFT